MPKITDKDAHNESSLYIYIFFKYMDLCLSTKKRKEIVFRLYNHVYMDLSNELLVVALFNE